jgi:putative transposase
MTLEGWDGSFICQRLSGNIAWQKSRCGREFAPILAVQECAALVQEGQGRKKYPSDLTDEPWAIVAPLLPPAKQSARGGRPRPGNMRAGLPTLLSRHRRGCPWERWAHDGPPQSPASDSCGQGRDDGTWAKLLAAWRERTRVAAGRAPPPRAACLERQAAKTTELGGPARGDEGGKKSPRRQRPLWVDTLGLGLAVLMTRAGLDAGGAAPLLLGHVSPSHFPRLVTIVAEQQYPHPALDAWLAAHRPGWHSAVQARPVGTQGLTPCAKRWGMERTHAWPSRCRRNRKDAASTGESSTAMLHISHRHLLLHRRAPCRRPMFHDRKEAA